mgnify:CR=1 FL=1
MFNNTELKFEGTSNVPIFNGDAHYKRIYTNINVTPGITYTLDNFKVNHNNNS